MTKTFGSMRAVDDLDLDVPRGALYGVIGPNGAGRTTTVSTRLLFGKPPDLRTLMRWVRMA